MRACSKPIEGHILVEVAKAMVPEQDPVSTWYLPGSVYDELNHVPELAKLSKDPIK